MTKYELYILPGKRAGSLTGSPEYVAGDVIAGMYWRTANIMGIGDFRPSFPPVCRSLAGAPKEITGNFDCMIDPDEFKRGPGFLNGAPLTVGGKYFTVTFPPDDPPEKDGRSRLTGSFLWDDGGNISPAFADGMSRRYGGSIKVCIRHPVPVASRRRKTQDLCIGGVGRGKELSDLMFPDAEFTCVYTQVRGNPDECINWLCEVNGVGGVIR